MYIKKFTLIRVPFCHAYLLLGSKSPTLTFTVISREIAFNSLSFPDSTKSAILLLCGVIRF